MPYKKEFERHIIFKNFKVETELRSKISQNSPMFKRKKKIKTNREHFCYLMCYIKKHKII